MPFDFYIFGDRIFTNLSLLGNSQHTNSINLLINKTIFTDIPSYINQLINVINHNQNNPALLSLNFMSTQKSTNIEDIIQMIKDFWNDNQKEFPNERMSFISDIDDKKFLPLIASHTLNESLIDYFINLNDDDINGGLVLNPLLTNEQIIKLIQQKPALGHYIIQDTSYKISSELLQFFVSQDILNSKSESKSNYSDSIMFYRDNLSDIDIITMLPALNDDTIDKTVLWKELPQYINEMLILNYSHLKIENLLVVKYRWQEGILKGLFELGKCNVNSLQ